MITAVWLAGCTATVANADGLALVHGQTLMAPSCPAERSGDACAPKPVRAPVALETADGEHLQTTYASDAGRYGFEVAIDGAARYRIRVIDDGEPGPPHAPAPLSPSICVSTAASVEHNPPIARGRVRGVDHHGARSRRAPLANGDSRNHGFLGSSGANRPNACSK